jgi:hypothetical protein
MPYRDQVERVPMGGSGRISADGGALEERRTARIVASATRPAGSTARQYLVGVFG